MTTRRGFLRSLVAATATVPALKNDALARAVGANRGVVGRAPADVAQDEDYWQTIQQAFDIDRGLINLNNGGVAPSPRVVQQALQHYLTVWKQRERRDGIVLKQIPFPVPPPSQDDLASRIEQAITPRTKVIHVCHITNLTGQIFPVKKICQLGRARGIEVIVDGAHAYAHFPFTRDELDCDYYGTSLHKWLTAPIGTGFLYVRRAKIAKIWPMMAAPPEMNENIRKFEEIGTHPAANHNAIVEALDFLDGIGPERKAARLRFLRDRWAKRLERLPDVKILTPYDPAQSCGLAAFTPAQLDVGKVASLLFDRHRIIVTPIAHPEFNCLRITPNVYTTLAEIDRFADVMEDVLRKGLPTS